MEELSEALKPVERELNFARKAYNSILHLYWSVAFPVIYMTSSILSAYIGASANSFVVLFSALAILLFLFEELKTSRKVRGIEKALGRKTPFNPWYLLIQALVWPVVIVIAGILVLRVIEFAAAFLSELYFPCPLP